MMSLLSTTDGGAQVRGVRETTGWLESMLVAFSYWCNHNGGALTNGKEI